MTVLVDRSVFSAQATRLLTATHYRVYVVAQSAEGSSLPSAEILLLTLTFAGLCALPHYDPWSYSL